MHYKDAIYASYRSAFKGAADFSTLTFGASKLQSVIEPWIHDLSRDSKIVDLGCGAGELLLAFKSLRFTNLSGCDLSMQQIAIARSIAPDVEVANLFDYLAKLPDGTIEVVTLFDVIEHLTRQETFELFGLIKSKLSSRGLLIGHVPNGLSPFVGHVYYGDPTHEWCPTPSAIKTLLSVTGFDGFEAVEHVGTSSSIKGRLRALAWRMLRMQFVIANIIETGSQGDAIWTRNFAFRAVR